MQHIPRLWNAYKEFSAAKELLLAVVALVGAVLAAGGVRVSPDELTRIALAVIAALLAAATVLFAFAAFYHRVYGTSPIVEYVDRIVGNGGHGSALPESVRATVGVADPPLPLLEEEVAGGAFKDAPHLLWSNVRAARHDRAFEVQVVCNNVGKIAQVIPTFTWVTSTVDVLGPPIPGTNPIQAEITKHDELIRFIDFDTSGQIEPSAGPGPFTLRMRCIEQDPIPGEREVRWRITYMDDDMLRGYITECSARIAFVMDSPTVVGVSALDKTSRKARNDDYNNFMRDKKAPSTGSRRSHE